MILAVLTLGCGEDQHDPAVPDYCLDYPGGPGAWELIDTIPEASALYGSAVWTGREWVVFGGISKGMAVDVEPGGTGFSYRPDTGDLTVLTPEDGPRVKLHAAVWTGDTMFLWGGEDFSNTKDGAWTFDVDTLAWSEISQGAERPLPRSNHTMASTPEGILLWGGHDSNENQPRHDGWSFDLDARVWSPMSLEGAPEAELRPASVWTGSELLIWGGEALTPSETGVGIDSRKVRSGAAYNPASDTWRPIRPAEAAPPPRPTSRAPIPGAGSRSTAARALWRSR